MSSRLFDSRLQSVKFAGARVFFLYPIRRIFVDRHQPVRFGERERIDDHCVQSAENGYIDANAERKREERQRRKPRLMAERAKHGQETGRNADHSFYTDGQPESYYGTNRSYDAFLLRMLYPGPSVALAIFLTMPLVGQSRPAGTAITNQHVQRIAAKVVDVPMSDGEPPIHSRSRN